MTNSAAVTKNDKQETDGYPSIDELLEYNTKKKKKKTIIVNTSGVLEDNVFFHIIFIEYKGKYIPICVTSSGEIFPVYNNAALLVNDGLKPNEITDDQHYYFFYRGNLKCKIKQPLFWNDKFNIFTVDNHVLSDVKRQYFPEKKKLYELGSELIYDYWDHCNPYEYDIVLTHIIDSCIIWAMGKTFFYIPNGKKATGKSTIQRVIAHMQFNGYFGGKGTVAVSCRLTHCLGVNINQDEYDKLSKDEKKDFTGMANNGAYSDGTYIFTNTNRRRIEDQITVLGTFAQRSFSTNKLSGFDDTFLSRCYINNCVPNNRPVKDLLDLSITEKERFQDFRNKCFDYTLFNWFKIKNSILDVKEELLKEKVFGRKNDMTSIILGIIKYFKGDYYREVKDYLKEKDEVTEKEDWDTYESIIFNHIATKYYEEKDIAEVSNKELVHTICDNLGIDYTDKEKRPHPRTIGAILRKHNLLNKPENISRGGKGGSYSYTIPRGAFIEMLKRFDYKSIANSIIEHDETLENKSEKLSSIPSISSIPSNDFELNELNELNEDRVEVDITLIIGEMEKHPKKKWFYTEIAKALDYDDPEYILGRLKEVTAAPDNPYPIRRTDEQGEHYILTEVKQP